jgi:predicted acyltransferase
MHISKRIASIDILRAVTMLLMIFVNDLWSLKDIPLWLEHTEANEDGMGLADTVFPAFLFIVGLSIPYAIAARKNKGENNLDISWHILSRSVALIVMGVFLVNGEYINETATGMSRVVWNMACVTCFILIWNVYPSRINKTMVRMLKMIAIGILVFLSWKFRAGEEGVITVFSTYWWGILGLIGWAYLVSSLVYLFSNRNFYVNLIAWLLFLFLCIANHAHWLPVHGISRSLLSPIGEGSMVALVMGGVVVSQLFTYCRQHYDFKKTLLIFFVVAACLVIAGFLLRPLGGISKIKATPSWVLICSGITIIMLMLFYWIADILKKAKWFNIIEPAGTNTLLCYLLPYYAYGIPVLLAIHLPAVLLTGFIGLIKSFLFALLMVVIAGWMGKMQVRLKL